MFYTYSSSYARRYNNASTDMLTTEWKTRCGNRTKKETRNKGKSLTHLDASPTENNTPTAQLNSQAVIRLERQSSRWNRRNTASSKSLCLFALITLSFFERYFGKLKREKYCEKKPASQGCTQGRLPRDPCTLGTSEQCAGVIQGRAGLVTFELE